TATSSGNGITTPTPIQSGMVSDCNAFHLVASGDLCQTIATDAGISLTDFYTWNPTVGSGCSSLWLGYYVCTGIVGDSTTTGSPATTPSPTVTLTISSSSTLSYVSTTTTSTSRTGVIPPGPTQTGITSACTEYYITVEGKSRVAVYTA
ncbi:MAG TPA: LysM domain-containing protein, partial [Candidatus Saccharimonadales bacterium]